MAEFAILAQRGEVSAATYRTLRKNHDENAVLFGRLLMPNQANDDDNGDSQSKNNNESSNGWASSFLLDPLCYGNTASTKIDDDNKTNDSAEKDPVVHIHPLLWEFLECRNSSINGGGNGGFAATAADAPSSAVAFLKRLPTIDANFVDLSEQDITEQIPCHLQSVSVKDESVVDTASSSSVMHILVEILFADRNVTPRTLAAAFKGCLLAVNQPTVMLLHTYEYAATSTSRPTTIDSINDNNHGDDDEDGGGYILVSAYIQEHNDDDVRSDTTDALRVYRVESSSRIQVIILEGNRRKDQSLPETARPIPPIPCPGQESILESLFQMVVALEAPVAPTGLLLTGCAGVGKSRMIQALRGRLVQYQQQYWSVQIVSCRRLLLEANSWGDDDRPDLLDAIAFFNDDSNSMTQHRRLVVFEDLDVLGNTGEEGDSLDHERRLVLSTLLQCLERIIDNDDECKDHASVVIGVGRSRQILPEELTKATRLETELSLPAPTMNQRQQMLEFLLQPLVADDDRRLQWADILAEHTAGCVAGDLGRMCTDMATQVGARNQPTTIGGRDEIITNNSSNSSPLTWEEAVQAVQRLIPSQLALLDVVKSRSSLGSRVSLADPSPRDWEEEFQQSWRPMAGYTSMKRRLYRSVVLPWRRRLRNNAADAVAQPFAIAPVSGVIFHGPSGSGKSLAAVCLGASLGLPMIQVRAADVLDKYVGGSEGIIRSIFARARSAAPCVVWLDEIDAIAVNRGGDEESSTGVMPRLLSTLLNEIDGVSSGQENAEVHVLVVACTNRLDSLDSALLRPRRLEEHVALELPDEEDILAILGQKLERVPLETQDRPAALSSWAKLLVSKNASGADVNGIVREAVLRGMRRDEEGLVLTNDDFLDALNYIL